MGGGCSDLLPGRNVQIETGTGMSKFFGLLISLAAMIALSFGAHARVEIDITRGNVEPLPVAIMDFSGNQVAQDIAGVVEANLRNSGLFKLIEKAAFLQPRLDPNSPPKFEDWRAINAQALVNGQVSKLPDGRLRAEFRLWDIFAADQLTGQRVLTELSILEQLNRQLVRVNFGFDIRA